MSSVRTRSPAPTKAQKPGQSARFLRFLFPIIAWLPCVSPPGGHGGLGALTRDLCGMSALCGRVWGSAISGQEQGSVVPLVHASLFPPYLTAVRDKPTLCIEGASRMTKPAWVRPDAYLKGDVLYGSSGPTSSICATQRRRQPGDVSRAVRQLYRRTVGCPGQRAVLRQHHPRDRPAVLHGRAIDGGGHRDGARRRARRARPGAARA